MLKEVRKNKEGDSSIHLRELVARYIINMAAHSMRIIIASLIIPLTIIPNTIKHNVILQ